MTQSANSSLLERLGSLRKSSLGKEQTSREFADKAREILNSEHPPSETDLLFVLDDKDVVDETRFAAFYLIQTRRWQQRDYGYHEKATRKYRNLLQDQPMFPFFVTQLCLIQATGRTGHTPDSSVASEALNWPSITKDKAPHVPGVLHLYGETVISIAEDHTGMVTEAELSLARHAVLEAQFETGQPRYAKYDATLARILAFQKQWVEARNSIARALNCETSTRSDYALRMMEYELVRAKIDAATESDELRKQQGLALDDMRATRRETLQVMGLLAAVIAFLVSSANIVQDFTPRRASGVLLVSAACILLVFSGFATLFGRDYWSQGDWMPGDGKHWGWKNVLGGLGAIGMVIWRGIPVFLLALLMIVAGLWVGGFGDGGGATALCNDGTLSYAAHQGACSQQGGVKVFYK